VAGGDFKARIELRGALSSLPALCELTDSFNTMAQELENTELLRIGFINDFSHEFKTPIVSIAGFAKLLRRGGLSEAQKQEYLAIIEEESLRLAAMANHVMELTKVENQTILTEVSEFNLSEQLRGCVLLLEGKWAQKGILPELNFREHRIHGNEELLKQVWINLLDNAIKFSEERSEIRVEIAETPEGLAVSVTNYGPDIPPESMDKIWRKFYQAEESHASLGSGIGLAIVKRAVELHRGKVSATSQNGVTTFTVELPK